MADTVSYVIIDKLEEVEVVMLVSTKVNEGMGSEGFLPRDVSFATRAIATKFDPLQLDSGNGAPTIVTSATFKQETPDKPSKYIYGRVDNPNRQALEELLAAIEEARYGVCFASGLGAVNSIFQLLKAGDHLLATVDLYGGTYLMIEKILPNHGLDVEFIDVTDPNIIREKVKSNTKMLLLENPTNPLIKYIDVEAASKIAHEYNLLVVIDSTFISPYFMKPLSLGVDIVFHSLTKYINGHSDVIMGAALTNDDTLYKRLRYLQDSNGVIPSPFDCYLVVRGIRTLKARMELHMRNSYSVAKFLETHPKVEKVNHPGLESHPHRQIAQKQTSGWGGMLSFYIRNAGLKESKTFILNLKVLTSASSLGGLESLVEIPAVCSHEAVPPEEKKRLGITDNLIRISVGLEEAADLIADLKQALDSLAEDSSE